MGRPASDVLDHDVLDLVRRVVEAVHHPFELVEDLAGGEVDAVDLGQDDVRVGVAAQDVAHGRRDPLQLRRDIYMLGALIRGEPRSRLQVHVRRDLRESVGTVEYQCVATILEERAPVREKG